MTVNKRKPTIMAQQVNENCAVLTLKVDADILDFQGHFTDHPLLPGVTQIDWAFYYAKQCFLLSSEFCGMEVLKFQEPILPDSTIELTLTWCAEKQKLSFCYVSADTEERHQHSTGRIVLREG